MFSSKPPTGLKSALIMNPVSSTHLHRTVLSLISTFGLKKITNSWFVLMKHPFRRELKLACVCCFYERSSCFRNSDDNLRGKNHLEWIFRKCLYLVTTNVVGHIAVVFSSLNRWTLTLVSRWLKAKFHSIFYFKFIRIGQ